MYYFVDIVCSFAEIIFIVFLFGTFFTRRENRKTISWITYVIFGLILIFLSLQPALTFLRTLYWIIGGTILALLLFESKPLPSFFVSLSYVVICALTEVAVMLLLSLFNLENQEVMQNGDVRSLFIIICHIVELLLIVGVRFITGCFSAKLSVRVLFPACPSLSISILFCCLLASEISSSSDINPFYIIVAIGLLYTSILVLLYTIKIQAHQAAQHDLELVNHHYAMQKEYYEQLHSQQEQTRALWHDISKYIRAVEAETASGSSLSQLQDMVNSIASVVDVQNQVVSVILNEYVQLAKDSNTTLTLDVQIPEQLPITAADLYILFGNTLDNALEACATLPENERQIFFQLRMHNQMLFYRISNPYSDNHPKRKRNQFHGYGLKNVQECIKRNNGRVEITSGDHLFVVSVLINCI